MKPSRTPFGTLVKVIHAFMIPIRSPGRVRLIDLVRSDGDSQRLNTQEDVARGLERHASGPSSQT